MTTSGGDLNFIDTTLIHDNQQTQIPGTRNPIVYQFDSIWDPADAGLIAMKAAYDASAERAFRMVFGTAIQVFNGNVGASLAPTGTAQDLVLTPVVTTSQAAPTFYA